MFGIHYEADNSRLYVVCAKHVTQTQLLDEFKVFGTAEVKLNCDVNGFSKVPFVHFYRPISRLFIFLSSFSGIPVSSSLHSSLLALPLFLLKSVVKF